ncbi:hypothetical protein IFU00_03460 [Oxalobacteraceae sp. CFBP 8761]|nr:hypothetical protein [Oxalobacteraceae sp. CFBP 8761]
MKYIKTTKKPRVSQFLVDEKINLNEFRSIMKDLASKLKSKVEWIAMPGAEIGKIKLSTGEIYAKLDFEYGLEFGCDSLVDYEIMQIEAVLKNK